MRRLVSAVKQDLRLQFRHGFYHVYTIISVLYIVVLRFSPQYVRELLLPVLIFSDPGMLGFYFIAALVLYEKEARSLQAVSVTPLRPSEYLLAKAISLSTLAVLASVVVAGFGWGLTPRLLLLVPVVGVCGTLVVFAGYSFVVRHNTFSMFLLQSIPVLVVLGVPILDILGLVQSPLFYLFPSHPALLAIRGIFLQGGIFVIIINTAILSIWAYIFYRIALKAHTKYILGRG
ncbi:MAG: putative ABC transporter permease [Bacillota bacterium]|nr:MAG: putative ABC transporter permease [Bacillota bacterium]